MNIQCERNIFVSMYISFFFLVEIRSNFVLYSFPNKIKIISSKIKQWFYVPFSPPLETKRGGTPSDPRSPSEMCSSVDSEQDSSRSQWPWLSSTRSSLRKSPSTEWGAQTRLLETPEALKRHLIIRLLRSPDVNKTACNVSLWLRKHRMTWRDVAMFPLNEK